MELADKAVENIGLVAEHLKNGNENISKQNADIQQALSKLEQATIALREKVISIAFQEIFQQLSQIKNPIKMKEELRKIIHSEAKQSKLHSGQVYLPKSKIEEAYKVFSKQDIQLQSMFLRDNLKIWNNKNENK